MGQGAGAGAVAPDWRERYRQRLKRRRLLWRALRARRRLTPLSDRTDRIGPGDILCFVTLRNEADRLPWFLAHYRALGVGHFLIVDNMSGDGSGALLAGEPDISVWQTADPYREARFGMDWLGWLHMRYGHGHWCLSVDADELLVFPHSDTRGLGGLTAWLDGQGAPAMGAMMLDMYPEGPLGGETCPPGEDPMRVLSRFDAWGYDWEYLARYDLISIRGGVRRRMFFADQPDHAPHLHKIPLIRWNRRFVYLSSMHSALPRRLNRVFDARLGLPTGVLLHTKFLDSIVAKSEEEKRRRQHFTHSERYEGYYDSLIARPVLRDGNSQVYEGPAQLEALGLMTRGRWA